VSLSSRFGDDLCKYLNENVTSYEWETEVPIGGHTRERVDVGGKPKGRQTKRKVPILIEAELKREDPVGNILKVWTRTSSGAYRRGVIFIQGFSNVYRSKKYPDRCTKGNVAIKFGKLLQRSSGRKVRYLHVEIDYYPRAGRTEGDGARKDWAHWFGGEIVRRLRRLHVPLKDG
jgi:hypothetical protein